MYVPSKTESVAKLFFIASCIGLLMYILLAFYTFHTAYSSMFRLQNYQEPVQGLPNMEMGSGGELKYILLWTTENNSLTHIGEGQKPFIDRECLYENCYVTANKVYLKDYSYYDAIIFDSKNLRSWKDINFPSKRSHHQKYIFHSDISSIETPICNSAAENYFNWTWSYKLDSDIISPFIEVKDIKGNIVAPKASVSWKQIVTDLSAEELQFAKQKSKTMAWVVTKCISTNDRMRFAKVIRRVFKKRSLVFDIYGCGNLICPNGECQNKIKEYYFYFAIEDSSTDDYVTKEVTNAFENYAVPVVFGGANYTRFLPEGSYINTRGISVGQLVDLVQYIINNPEVYHHFHRWRKYYTINKAPKFKGICEMCKNLNDDSKFGTTSVRTNFRKWWYPGPLFQRCIPKDIEDGLVLK